MPLGIGCDLGAQHDRHHDRGMHVEGECRRRTAFGQGLEGEGMTEQADTRPAPFLRDVQLEEPFPAQPLVILGRVARRAVVLGRTGGEVGGQFRQRCRSRSCSSVSPKSTRCIPASGSRRRSQKVSGEDRRRRADATRDRQQQERSSASSECGRGCRQRKRWPVETGHLLPPDRAPIRRAANYGPSRRAEADYTRQHVDRALGKVE